MWFTLKSQQHGLAAPTAYGFLDPIDGTINFASGLPLYAVSIAYQREGAADLGGTVVPGLRKYYFARRRGGAFCNGARLHVSTRPLADALVSVVLTSHFSRAETDRTVGILSVLARRAQGIRIILSEALELGWLAEGALDGNLCVKADACGTAVGALLATPG